MNWRPIATGALSLIALQVFVTGHGPEAGGRLLGWVATALNKAISPNVAAVPYVGKKPPGKAAQKPTTPAPSTPGATPATGPLGLGTNPTVVTV